MADLPIVDQAAKVFGWAIEERLLFRRQRDRRDGAQFGPVGGAGEKLCVEADGAGVEGLLLGIGHLGQCLFQEIKGGGDEKLAADLGNRQGRQNADGYPGKE